MIQKRVLTNPATPPTVVPLVNNFETESNLLVAFPIIPSKVQAGTTFEKFFKYVSGTSLLPISFIKVSLFLLIC
jgi:hypothetical protein